MIIEIKENEINAMKWLLKKGMEQTNSDRKFQVFERLSDDLHQRPERVSVDAIVICPLCEEACDFDAHENGYFWAGCNTCNTYASSFSIDELRQRLRRNTEARMGT